MSSYGMRITLALISLPLLLLCVAVLWLFVSTGTFPEFFYSSRIDAIRNVSQQIYAELGSEEGNKQSKIVATGQDILKRPPNIEYAEMGVVVRDDGRGAFVAAPIGMDSGIYYYLSKKCYVLFTPCFLCTRVLITTLNECDDIPELNLSSNKE